jgi:hypothetical protein
LLLASFCSVQAQEQEGKLVDRLLRPNTTLANDAQNKKFTSNPVGVDKHARVGTFYMQRNSEPKTYSNTRDFKASQFKSNAFDSTGSGNSVLATRSTTQPGSYATKTATPSANLHDADKHIDSNGFAGNRPFLEKGKSQKSLDRKNAPMTIEQVRELLNKNK